MRPDRADSSFIACLAALVALGQVLCGCLSAAQASAPNPDEVASHVMNMVGLEEGTETPCPPDGCEHCDQTDAALLAAGQGDDLEKEVPSATLALPPHLVSSLPAERLTRTPRAPPARRPFTPVSRFDVLLA